MNTTGWAKPTSGTTIYGLKWEAWIETTLGKRTAHVRLVDTDYTMDVAWDPGMHGRRDPSIDEYAAWAGALEMRMRREAGDFKRKGERR